MSQPRPMVSPPEASITVKAPIHVPSPTTGSPTTQACSFQGLGGSDALMVGSLAPDELGHAGAHVDRRLEAEDLLGTGGVGRAAAHQHVAGVELRLDVGADRVDEDAGQVGDRGV